MKATHDLAEVRKLADSELAVRYSHLKRELYDARMRVQAIPTSEIQRLRKTIARVLTVARERNLKIS